MNSATCRSLITLKFSGGGINTLLIMVYKLSVEFNFQLKETINMNDSFEFFVCQTPTPNESISGMKRQRDTNEENISKIQKLEAKNDRLKKKNKVLKKKKKVLKKKNEVLTSEVNWHEKSSIFYRNTCRMLRDELDDESQRNEDFVTRIDQLENKKDQVEIKLNTETNKRKNLIKTKIELYETIRTQDRQLERLQKKLDELKQPIKKYNLRERK